MNHFRAAHEAIDAAEREASRTIEVPSRFDMAGTYRRLKQIAGRGKLDIDIGQRWEHEPESVRYCWHFEEAKGRVQYDMIFADSLPELIAQVENTMRQKPAADTLEDLERNDEPADLQADEQYQAAMAEIRTET